MSPPTYGDLGKSARDIFGKGYHFGSIKLEAKTKTETGLEVTTGGAHALETGKVNGNLETKYKCGDYGLTITEKWSTDNVLNTDISLDDKLAKGLKVGINGSFTPATGKKSAKVSGSYKTDILSVNADSTVDVAGPQVNGSAVLGYKDWLMGYQMAFDTSKTKLTKNNFAVGYVSGDFALHTYANDGAEFGGSLYHKLGSGVETGVDMGWSANSNTTKFALGCKYGLDKNSTIRAKVNNNAFFGIGYQHKLRDGVTMTLSTLIDGKNFNAGGHKVGLALDFSA